LKVALVLGKISIGEVEAKLLLKNAEKLAVFSESLPRLNRS
jgi:hypothetical protein